MTTSTRERTLTTRRHRQEQRIAKITKDYLLGKHIGNRSECAICGRDLSDPPSIARAIGSECWPKLQDRLASEVPRCAEKIEQLQLAITEHEKHDLAYWQTLNAQKYGHLPQENVDWITDHDLRQTSSTIAILKRQLADTELLLAAARKWVSSAGV
jgi:hypothetical protein